MHQRFAHPVYLLVPEIVQMPAVDVVVRCTHEPPAKPVPATSDYDTVAIRKSTGHRPVRKHERLRQILDLQSKVGQ
jgi:hypothetical protein